MTEIKFPLNIPDVEVISTNFSSSEEYVIRVKSIKVGTKCHRCGQLATHRHGYGAEITLRHVSILDHPVYIKIKPVRYRCEHCDDDTTTTEQPDWYGRRSKFTKAYEKYLMRMLINSTIEDMMKKESLNAAEIAGALDRQVSTKINWEEFKLIEILGLDEIAIKKGHKDFVVIVSTKINNKVRVLGVLPDRKKETVKAFLRELPEQIKQQITTICSDLYDGFINASLEEFGYRVQVVADRFHVAKNYRKCLDKVRKEELKRLKKELLKTDYEKLKGAMWILRKKEKSLSSEDKRLLKQLFIYSEKIKEAYELQNELTAIFDKKLSRNTASKKIKAWQEKVLGSGVKKYFESFLTTLSNYFSCIVNYFDSRQNSGFVEGFNNKIKVLKRRCYGIYNLAHLFQRIVLDTTGHEQFARLCTNP